MRESRGALIDEMFKWGTHKYLPSVAVGEGRSGCGDSLTRQGCIR